MSDISVPLRALGYSSMYSFLYYYYPCDKYTLTKRQTRYCLFALFLLFIFDQELYFRGEEPGRLSTWFRSQSSLLWTTYPAHRRRGTQGSNTEPLKTILVTKENKISQISVAILTQAVLC